MRILSRSLERKDGKPNRCLPQRDISLRDVLVSSVGIALQQLEEATMDAGRPDVWTAITAEITNALVRKNGGTMTSVLSVVLCKKGAFHKHLLMNTVDCTRRFNQEVTTIRHGITAAAHLPMDVGALLKNRQEVRGKGATKMASKNFSDMASLNKDRDHSKHSGSDQESGTGKDLGKGTWIMSSLAAFLKILDQDVERIQQWKH